MDRHDITVNEVKESIARWIVEATKELSPEKIAVLPGVIEAYKNLISIG